MIARTRRPIPPLAWALVAIVTGCSPTGANTPPPMPPAELYEQPPNFIGEWRGEVGEAPGTLRISALGKDGVYRGVYEGEPDVVYVLKLEQTVLEENGQAQLSNRIVFTWQDAHGGRGSGWLLIDRGSDALTGAFGEGGGHNGGRWSFSRS